MTQYNVRHDAGNQCVLFDGPKTRGYGRVSIRGKEHYARRACGMTQFFIRYDAASPKPFVVYATEFGIDQHDLAGFKTPREAITYSDSLDTPAMPSTARRAFSPGGTSTGSDDGIAGAPKRATRQRDDSEVVLRTVGE